MKRTLFLMTVLNLVAMTAGIGTAMADGVMSAAVTVPEPTSLLLVAAGLLGIAGISWRKRK